MTSTVENISTAFTVQDHGEMIQITHHHSQRQIRVAKTVPIREIEFAVRNMVCPQMTDLMNVVAEMQMKGPYRD